MAMVILTALVAGLAWIWLISTMWRHSQRASIALLVLGIGGGGFLGFRASRSLGEPTTPLNLFQVSYVRSGACAKCHADHYRSWATTYHRTMTQPATPESVIGDFSIGSTTVGGHPAVLGRDGDTFYMELVDWDWERQARLSPGASLDLTAGPRRRYDVHRLVGSHELQVYLTRLDSGAYITLPLEWNERRKRWVTSPTNYLQPPSEHGALFANVATWNARCAYCHNTRPNPGADRSAGTFETRLEEMGIACEACHGPGRAHIAANRDPIRRGAYESTGRADPTIVNPERLSQNLALEVCGRCHGKWFVRSSHRQESETRGDPHIPGQRPLAVAFLDPLRTMTETNDQTMAGYFWPDLTPRATAMEYQGVKMSPCAQRGPMTCESCHSMHDAPADDQLIHRDNPTTRAWEQNAACTQCHSEFDANQAVAAHTHHEATSTGSICVSCHMPFQTFGLMKSTRSHRITNPDASVTLRSHIPNGCNECHPDKPLRWTAEHLTQWYDAAEVSFPPEEPRARWSETLVQLSSGHALSRALAARALGDADPWAIPFLIEALEDDYAAVRQLAELSLRRQPGFEDMEYDYTLPTQNTAHLLDAWKPERPVDVPMGVPLSLDGRVLPEIWEPLRSTRDHRPMTIFE